MTPDTTTKQHQAVCRSVLGSRRAGRALGPWLGNLALAAVSLAVCVGLSELALRLLYRPPLTPSCVVTNPRRLYALRPSCSGFTYDRPFHISGLGCRGGESVVDSAAIRIAVYGDSITFGHGVGDEEPFAQVLQALLADRWRLKVQVFNLGVPSYNTAMEYQHVLDTFDTLRPNLLVLQYTADNDALPARALGVVDRNATLRFLKDLARSLYLYDWLARRAITIRDRFLEGVRGTHGTDVVAAGIARINRLHESSQPGWIRARTAIDDIAHFAAARNVPLLVGATVNTLSLAPTREEDGALPTIRSLEKALCVSGVHHALLFDDVLRPMSSDQSKLWVSASDHHYSATAHRLVGSALALRIATTWTPVTDHGGMPRLEEVAQNVTDDTPSEAQIGCGGQESGATPER